MFKSIISKIKTFGQTVVNRIVGFIGGIIGIKPEAIQIPAPPEVTNEVSDTAKEVKSEEKKEGVLNKAFNTVKKAVTTAIKAVFSLIVDVLNLFFNIVIFSLIIGSVLGLGLATAYAINYILIHLGIIALATTLWETKAVAEIGLLVLALVGVVNITSAIAEVIWYLLLKRIHIFLWSVLFRDALKNIPTNTIVDIDSSPTKNINLEFSNGVYNKEEITTVVDPRPTKKEPAMTMKIIEVPVSSVEKVSETVTTNEVKDVDIFDSIPVVIEIEEILPEIVPVVIEIEEEVPTVVDTRPTKSEPIKLKIDNQKELLSQIMQTEDIDSVLWDYRSSDLKSVIATLNKSIPDGINKGNNRKDKKSLLIQEIKKQLQYFNKNVVVA
jgi:hypothetical protein